MTPSITDTEPPAQSQKIWTDLEVLELLAKHTYDEVHALTTWSRGRIYAAACRHSARKNEHRIIARRKHRLEVQREFLQQAMNVTERMDALDYLAGIPDDSVSCVLSSPPYNLGKSYGESGAGVDALRFSYYYGWLVMVVAEMARILKPGGTLCLQVGQTIDWAGSLYPIDVMIFEDLRRAGLTYQSRVAWVFGHGLTPKKRLAERYETMLVFSKGPQQVFNPNAARIPQLQPGKRAFKGPNRGSLSGNPMGAHPTNVWTIPQVGHNHPEKTGHPCQFPGALARRAILLYTMAGDLVCDPFTGSGTTPEACVHTGRAFTGADLHYEDTRNQRLAKAFPDLVTALPGVTDESVAVWQAEARVVQHAARPITAAEERDLFSEVFA